MIVVLEAFSDEQVTLATHLKDSKKKVDKIGKA